MQNSDTMKDKKSVTQPHRIPGIKFLGWTGNSEGYKSEGNAATMEEVQEIKDVLPHEYVWKTLLPHVSRVHLFIS